MAKPRILFYLTPQALEVYSDQSDQPARLDFPTEIINHQEVFDLEKYNQILESFLSQMGIDGLNVVILLSQPLIFSQEFPFEQSSNTDEDSNKPLLDYNGLNTKIDQFVDQAPFDNNQIAKMELRADSSLLVLITNKALYQPIIDVLTKFETKVISVVPVTIFAQLAQKSILDTKDIEFIFSDKKALQQNNFLVGQVVDDSTAIKTLALEDGDDLAKEEDEDDEKSDGTSKFLLIFGSVFIIGGLIVLAVMLGLVKNPLAKTATVESPNNLTTQNLASDNNPQIEVGSNSAVLVGSNSAVLQAVKKDSVQISVINGSGIAGQGSKVKNSLTALGYKNITIDGTLLSGTSDTLVNFASTINSAARDEITQQLAKIFASIKTQDASPSAKVDIQITTGVYK